MPMNAILFDLDGTLLDTLDDLAEAANRVLDQAGLPTHAHSAYRQFIGDGSRMLVTRAISRGSPHAGTYRRPSNAFQGRLQPTLENGHPSLSRYPGPAERPCGPRHPPGRRDQQTACVCRMLHAPFFSGYPLSDGLGSERGRPPQAPSIAGPRNGEAFAGRDEGMPAVGRQRRGYGNRPVRRHAARRRRLGVSLSR